MLTGEVLVADDFQIFYYGTQYFKNAGFQQPFIIQVITNTVNVVSTFPGLYLVEKMGRRNLLLMGAIGRSAG
jgi:MFS transporter, SP family, sugar:H+ symporter